MTVSDRLGIGDAVRGKGKDRLGMPGPIRAGPLDEVNHIRGRTPRRHRRIDGETVVLAALLHLL